MLFYLGFNGGNLYICLHFKITFAYYEKERYSDACVVYPTNIFSALLL